MVEESQVVIHIADEPDSIADFLDPDVLVGEDGAQIDLAAPEADAAALGDGNGPGRGKGSAAPRARNPYSAGRFCSRSCARHRTRGRAQPSSRRRAGYLVRRSGAPV